MKKSPLSNLSATSKPSTTPATAPSIDARYAQFKLELRPSPIHRWGVYALEPIPKGKKIIEYTGERCNRMETAKRAGKALNYMFTLNSYWALDGSVGGSGAEYINHSCEPNCRAWICKDHILYMAEHAIRKGEELTIDYHFDPEVDEVPCACGAPRCRGTINLKRVRKRSAPAPSGRSGRKKSGKK